MTRAPLLQLALVAALVALAAAHVARGAQEDVTRVRVDLDLEQLGLVGTGAEDRIIELEIHCEGARPSHQIFMDGDVLIVRTEATPWGQETDHRLGVAARQGVAISVDLAEDLLPEPEIETEFEIQPEIETEFETEPMAASPEMEIKWTDPPIESAPETPTQPFEPRNLYEPTPADQLGMGGRDPISRTEFTIDDPDAVEEVMAALTEAMEEAHLENNERRREQVEEVVEESGNGQQTSSWSVERD